MSDLLNNFQYFLFLIFVNNFKLIIKISKFAQINLEDEKI